MRGHALLPARVADRADDRLLVEREASRRLPSSSAS